MTRKLNILIIGTGIYATSTYVPALRELSDKLQIAACYNQSYAKAQGFAKVVGLPEKAIYTNLDEALGHPNLDIVAILVPVQHNLELVRKAVTAGKHVMVEKPIAHNLHDASEVVKLSQSTDKIIMVAENFGYREYLNKVLSVIHSGAIGDIVTFNYVANRAYEPDENPYITTEWRQKPLHIGGYLSDGGVHNWAEIMHLLGRPSEVAAFATQLYEIHGAEDTIALSTKMESGVVGTFILSMATSKPAEAHFRIYGTQGTISISQRQKFQQGGAIAVDHIKVTVYENSGKVTEEDLLCGLGVEEEWLDFYNAITTGEALRVCPEDTYYHLAVIAAGIESSNTKQVVKITRL